MADHESVRQGRPSPSPRIDLANSTGQLGLETPVSNDHMQTQMSDKGEPLITLQLISEHTPLIEAVRKDIDITCEEVRFLNAPGEWRDRAAAFDISLLDMRSHGNTSEDAIRHIRSVKARNPGQAIIVIGNSEILVNLLESDVQPLLYRVFSSSTSLRQIVAAIRAQADLQNSPAKKPPESGNRHASGVLSNIKPRAVAAPVPAAEPVETRQSESPALPEEASNSKAPTEPARVENLIVSEPLPEEEFDNFFDNTLDDSLDQSTRVVDLLDDTGDNALLDDTGDTGLLDETLVIDTPQHRPASIDNSREKLLARQAVSASDAQYSRIGQAPFLIFATIGMPSLALLAYLLLWDPAINDTGTEQLFKAPETAENVLPAPEPASAPEPATPVADTAATETPIANETPGEPEPEQPTSQNAELAQVEAPVEAKPTVEAVESPVETASTDTADDNRAETAAREVASTLMDSLKKVGKAVSDVVQNPPVPTLGSSKQPAVETAHVASASVEQLVLWGKSAESEQRWVEPKDNNALFYYELALARDAGSNTARQGRQRALSQIEKQIASLLGEGDFVAAHGLWSGFDYSHPGHARSRGLRARVNSAVRLEVERVLNSPEENPDPLIARLNALGDVFGAERDKLIRLKQGRLLVAEIDKSLENGILLPPDPRNALEKIQSARSSGKISNKVLNDRAATMTHMLYSRGEQNVANAELPNARAALSAMRELNVDLAAITRLQQLIEFAESPGQEAVARQEGADEPAGKTEVQVGDRIQQAVVLEMIEPSYPETARTENIEGWVELSFVVDELGDLRDIVIVNEAPLQTFSTAAIDAVTQWRFQPAYDQIARANIPSEFSVRLEFSLP